jgi:ribonuclease J
MENVRVIIHRGSHQIGGCCTEIATDNTRILIDFGLPLPGEKNAGLNVDGANQDGVKVDGIFVTHYHGDHIGELNGVYKSVPIYMGKSSKQIMKEYQKHMGKHAMLKNPIHEINGFKNQDVITVGDIEVTAIESDHSSFQPYMFLICAKGKTILHTGDFRLHGNKRDKLVKEISKYHNIDLLITEGTTLTRTEDENWTEEKVEKKMKSLLKEYKYCFLLTSSGNLFRMNSFAKGILKGKYLISDDFQKRLIDIAVGEKPEEYSKLNKTLTYGANLAPGFENRGFGMIIRANKFALNLLENYMENYPEETCLIYSLWSGYLKEDSFRMMKEVAGKNFRICHSSGHVVLQDLNKFINMLNPSKIIVIHTDYGQEEMPIDLRERIIFVEDKKEINI